MSSTTQPRYLAIYLQDHHAGADAGRILVDRMRAENAGAPLEPMLSTLRNELEAEARTLTEVMHAMEVKPSRLKRALARAASRLARTKLNGHLVTYSPLSRLLELEGLRAAVSAKQRLWRTLQAVSAGTPRLQTFEFAELEQQSCAQLERIDHWHTWAAEQIQPAPAGRTASAPDAAGSTA